MEFEFVLVDVFSDRPFGGNQLAVFPDATGLADADMQRLAREFNFSETTFVLPPEDPAHTCRVRIFTPIEELPFAGHPTIGTAVVLARRRGDGPGVAAPPMVLGEEVGPIRVEFDDGAELCVSEPDYRTTTTQPPIAAIAQALSLPESAVLRSWYAAVGLAFCFVQLVDAETVDRAVVDTAAWSAALDGGWTSNLYLVAGDLRDGAEVYARMFAPGVGITEDAATGSACGALVASLAQQTPQRDGSYRLRVTQGVRMGRPSQLAGTAHQRAGRLTEIRVRGNAVIVGRGVIALP